MAAACFSEAQQPLANSDSDETDVEEGAPLLSRRMPEEGHCSVVWGFMERMALARLVLSAVLVVVLLTVMASKSRELRAVEAQLQLQLESKGSALSQEAGLEHEGGGVMRKEAPEELKKAMAASQRKEGMDGMAEAVQMEGEWLEEQELTEELAEQALEEADVLHDQEEQPEQEATEGREKERQQQQDAGAGCFELGVLYPLKGSPVQAVGVAAGKVEAKAVEAPSAPAEWPFVGFHRADDTEECQGYCQRHGACRFFTYRAPTQECFLLSKRGSERLQVGAEDGVVSGPKRCKGAVSF